MTEWKDAQFFEKDHWHRFTTNCAEGGERHWLDLWEPDAKLLVQVAEKLIGLDDNTWILEVGGGAIGHIRWFPKAQLFAIDPLRELFEERLANLDLSGYNVRSDVTYLGGRAEEFEVGGEEIPPFELILILNCLDHCDDPGKALDALRPTLSIGGYMFESTTVFSGGHPELDPEYTKMHPHIFRGDELTNLIYDHGFVMVQEPLTDEWCGEQGQVFSQDLHLWKRRW